MLKISSIGFISSFFLLSGTFLFPPSLPAQSAELADRDGLESAWKKSGRTTGVIDYPFSPQPGIYGGKTVREWGNRGYIFVNPRGEEFTRRRPRRTAEREEITVGEEDCQEIRAELLEEVARSEGLRQERDRLAEDMEALQDISSDRALKIEALEFQVEELERALLAEARQAEIAAIPGGVSGPAGPGTGEVMTYLVRKDDSLWKIAGKPEIYNDPYRWLLLYHANRDQIFLPDLIYPGMVLLVPRYPELEELPPSDREAEQIPGEEPAGEAAGPVITSDSEEE